MSKEDTCDVDGRAGTVNKGPGGGAKACDSTGSSE